VQGCKLWYIPLVFARRCCSMCYCSSRSISKSIKEVYFIWVTPDSSIKALVNAYCWAGAIFILVDSETSLGDDKMFFGMKAVVPVLVQRCGLLVFRSSFSENSLALSSLLMLVCKLDGPYIFLFFLSFLNLMLFGSISMFFSTHLKSQ